MRPELHGLLPVPLPVCMDALGVPAVGGTRHTDWMEVRAGWLTPLAWLAGVAFVRRRWQRLAARWREFHGGRW